MVMVYGILDVVHTNTVCEWENINFDNSLRDCVKYTSVCACMHVCDDDDDDDGDCEVHSNIHTFWFCR